MQRGFVLCDKIPALSRGFPEHSIMLAKQFDICLRDVENQRNDLVEIGGGDVDVPKGFDLRD